MVIGANEVVQTNCQSVDITRVLSNVRQICLQRKTKCFSVLKVESSTIGYHRAPRGVLDGRDESLVGR